MEAEKNANISGIIRSDMVDLVGRIASGRCLFFIPMCVALFDAQLLVL